MSLPPQFFMTGAEAKRSFAQSFFAFFFLEKRRLGLGLSFLAAGDSQAQVIQLLVIRPAKPVLRGPQRL